MLKNTIFKQKGVIFFSLYLLFALILLLIKIPDVHAAASDAYCGRTDFYNDFTYRFNTNDATITIYQGDKPFDCPESDKSGNKFEFIGKDITKNINAPTRDWYYFQSVDFPNYYLFVYYESAMRAYGLFWDLDLSKDPKYEAVDSFGTSGRYLYDSTNPSEKISFEVFKAAISKTGNENNNIGAIGSGEGENACPKFPGITKIGGALNWLVGGLICDLTQGINNWMINTLGQILEVEPLERDVGKPSYPAYVAWKEVLNISYVLFFLVFLVIIFAETLNLDPKTYAIGLMIPRLVIAIVFVFFSFTISGVIVDIGNVLGNQIAKLPTKIHEDVKKAIEKENEENKKNDPDSQPVELDEIKVGTAITIPIISIWSAIVFWEVIGAGMIIYLVGLLITVIIAFAVLVIREILIIAFIIGSPLVAVMFVLPATQKSAQSFLENFVKLVLMYPLIMLLLAGSSVISIIYASKPGAMGLVGSIVLLLTFALIPSTFKMAGGVMGVVGGGLMKMAGNLKGAVSKSDWAKGMRERAGEKNLARRTEQAQRLRAQGRWGTVKSWLVAGGTGSYRAMNQQYEKLIDDRTKSLDSELNVDDQNALAEANSLEDIKDPAKRRRLAKFFNRIDQRAAAKNLMSKSLAKDEVMDKYPIYSHLTYESRADRAHLNWMEDGVRHAVGSTERVQAYGKFEEGVEKSGQGLDVDKALKTDWKFWSDFMTPGHETRTRIQNRYGADGLTAYTNAAKKFCNGLGVAEATFLFQQGKNMLKDKNREAVKGLYGAGLFSDGVRNVLNVAFNKPHEIKGQQSPKGPNIPGNQKPGSFMDPKIPTKDDDD